MVVPRFTTRELVELSINTQLHVYREAIAYWFLVVIFVCEMTSFALMRCWFICDLTEAVITCTQNLCELVSINLKKYHNFSSENYRF